MCGSMVDRICDRWEQARKTKKEEEEKNVEVDLSIHFRYSFPLLLTLFHTFDNFLPTTITILGKTSNLARIFEDCRQSDVSNLWSEESQCISAEQLQGGSNSLTLTLPAALSACVGEPAMTNYLRRSRTVRRCDPSRLADSMTWCLASTQYSLEPA